jgi:hypothetical protein
MPTGTPRGAALRKVTVSHVAHNNAAGAPHADDVRTWWSGGLAIWTVSRSLAGLDNK